MKSEAEIKNKLKETEELLKRYYENRLTFSVIAGEAELKLLSWILEE